MDRDARGKAWTNLLRFLVVALGVFLALLLAGGALLTLAFHPSPEESAAATWALLAAGCCFLAALVAMHETMAKAAAALFGLAGVLGGLAWWVHPRVAFFLGLGLGCLLLGGVCAWRAWGGPPLPPLLVLGYGLVLSVVALRWSEVQALLGPLTEPVVSLLAVSGLIVAGVAYRRRWQ